MLLWIWSNSSYVITSTCELASKLCAFATLNLVCNNLSELWCFFRTKIGLDRPQSEHLRVRRWQKGRGDRRAKTLYTPTLANHAGDLWADPRWLVGDSSRRVTLHLSIRVLSHLPLPRLSLLLLLQAFRVCHLCRRFPGKRGVISWGVAASFHWGIFCAGLIFTLLREVSSVSQRVLRNNWLLCGSLCFQ